MMITIRSAHADDLAFILSLTPRFHDFELPAWLTAAQLDQVNQRTLSANISAPAPGAAMLIAQDAAGVALGFIHLQTETDYFSGQPQGYISDIAVAAEAEGRGVGQALMQAAETWTRAQGYRLLALHVFAQNARARRFYARLGFSETVISCVKTLDPPAPDAPTGGA